MKTLQSRFSPIIFDGRFPRNSKQ